MKKAKKFQRKTRPQGKTKRKGGWQNGVVFQTEKDGGGGKKQGRQQMKKPPDTGGFETEETWPKKIVGKGEVDETPQEASNGRTGERIVPWSRHCKGRSICQ